MQDIIKSATEGYQAHLNRGFAKTANKAIFAEPSLYQLKRKI